MFNVLSLILSKNSRAVIRCSRHQSKLMPWMTALKRYSSGLCANSATIALNWSSTSPRDFFRFLSKSSSSSVNAVRGCLPLRSVVQYCERFCPHFSAFLRSSSISLFVTFRCSISVAVHLRMRSPVLFLRNTLSIRSTRWASSL